ncbi:bZIP transcription factor [Colletotrichum asianum]
MASSGYPCPPDMLDNTAMFTPMPSCPSPPDQNGWLFPAEESQFQQWLGLDDHMVEPMYAENGPVDFISPSQLGAEAQDLESSHFGMSAEHTTAIWAAQADNWPPFQYENSQQPLVSLANTYKGESWHAPEAHSQPEPHSRAKKLTKTTKTTTNSKSRTPSSAAEQSYKRAKIGAGGKPSPSSSISSDDKVTTIDDDSVDEGEQSESWRPGSRQKYRAKNREAAKRCRVKTKRYEEDLAVKSREIEQQRMYLDECVTVLRSEVLALKNEILQHSDCDCELIQRYIAKAAGAVSAGAAPARSQEYQATLATGSSQVGWISFTRHHFLPWLLQYRDLPLLVNFGLASAAVKPSFRYSEFSHRDMAHSKHLDSAAMMDTRDISLHLYPTLPELDDCLSPTNDYSCRRWSPWNSEMSEYLQNSNVPAGVPYSSQWEIEVQGNPAFRTEGTDQSYGIASWAPPSNTWPGHHGQVHPSFTATNSIQSHWSTTACSAPAAIAAWQTPLGMQGPPAREAKLERPPTKTTKPRASSSATRQPLKKAKVGPPTGRACAPSSTSPKNETETMENDNKEDEESSPSPSGPERKKSYRVKNRAAAKRCREKTKQYELDLAAKEQEVTQQRIYLDACVTALRNEVLSLKDQILQHGDCDCDVIQGYIARAAGGVGGRTT